MMPRAVLFPLLFLGAAMAQDSAPMRLSGRDPSLICRGKVSDAPDCVTAPHTTYFPDPQYPEKERKARHRGTVVLTLVVDPDGLPRDIKVSRTLSPAFDKAAIDAVKKWKFTPATRDSKPIAVEIDVEVAFKLY
ncbi:MAG: energy transducer TonB [Terriglobales bacterium]